MRTDIPAQSSGAGSIDGQSGHHQLPLETQNTTLPTVQSEHAVTSGQTVEKQFTPDNTEARPSNMHPHTNATSQKGSRPSRSLRAPDNFGVRTPLSCALFECCATPCAHVSETLKPEEGAFAQ